MLRVFDAIEARLARIDARLDARKAGAPGQLNLFGGGAQTQMPIPSQAASTSKNSQKPSAVGRAARRGQAATARAGKPCGDGHISSALTCHKSGAAAAPEPRTSPKGGPKAALARESTRSTEGLSGSAAPAPFASPNDLSYDLAVQAHRGTSFDPEKRARSHQEDYAAHLNTLYADLQKQADTPEQKAILETEMKTYREGYTKRYTAWLGAKGRIMSPMKRAFLQQINEQFSRQLPSEILDELAHQYS
jgi:hypothetical protein